MMPVLKDICYDYYLGVPETEDPPKTRKQFDNETRITLREQYPKREIEGKIVIIDDECMERTVNAWFVWLDDENQICDCDFCVSFHILMMKRS